jgi:PKD repeat protein
MINFSCAYETPEYFFWNNSYRMEYFFSERNKPDSTFGYYWDTYYNEWTISERTITYFDENGFDTSSISYYNDYGLWIESYKQLMNYDPVGNKILDEVYYWNGEDWTPDSKETYSYNADNRMTQYFYYGWDYDLWDWYSYEMEEYFYDPTGNMIRIEYSYWDNFSGGWYPESKDEYTYDLSSNEEDIAMPNWWYEDVDIKMNIVSKLTEGFEFDWNVDMSTYDTSTIITLYYSDFQSTPDDALCQADFTWELDTVNPFLIHFHNLSAMNASSWYWDFGDGTTSTLKNPDHLYKSVGIYIVTLSTIDQTGFCNSSKSARIVVGIPVINALFYPLIDTLNRTVTFLNESGGALLNYFWTFGDGTTSTLKSPVHVYNKLGVYDVCLIIKNEAGLMDEFCMRLPLNLPECNADFTVFVDSTYNLAYFSSKAGNVQDTPNKYYWIFGDGSTSTLRNPVHRFAQPGFYSAMLTVYNERWGCIDSHKETILVGSPGIDCQADFIYSVGEDNNVFFSDRSSVPAKGYYWNFGDGQFSKEMNPSHKFPAPGYYNVCLIIYAENGIQNISCKKILIAREEIDLCLAQFYYLVNEEDLVSLTDASLGTPDSWLWKFSDGWTSNLQNPVYITAKPDFYVAQLQIQNSLSGCEDNAFGLINVGKDDQLKAGFGFIKRYSGLKAESYPVDLIGVSCGEGSKLKWDFGDGTYDSTTTNPTHEYTAPGAYNVCYTITDLATNESDEYCQIIYVGVSGISTEPVENEFLLTSYPNPFNKTCNISYTVMHKGIVELSLYDPSGRRVAEIDRSMRDPGSYEIEYDGSGLDNGVYYLLLRTGTGYATRLINIIK